MTAMHPSPQPTASCEKRPPCADWHRLAIATVVAVSLCALAWGTLRSAAQGSPAIGFSGPSPPEIWVGDPPTWVDIVITGTELYGYQFVVEFDPLMLEAVDSEFVDSFLKAEFTPSGWSGTIDNVAGTVKFAATQTWPTLPASGSGIVARVAFRGKYSPDLPEYTELVINSAKAAQREGDLVDLGSCSLWVLVRLRIQVQHHVGGICGVDYQPGGCITSTLIMTGENIYGYQFGVTFDPLVAQADSAGFDSGFVSADFSPPAWSATIDNVAGVVRFATTQEWPALPATGSGAVGWVCFSPVAELSEPVTTTLGFSDPRAANKDGDLMIPQGITASLVLGDFAKIYGQVEMQGRGDYSRCVASALTTPAEYTTTAEGWYTLTVCSGIYSVTLEMERYLDTSRAVTALVGLTLLPKVRLLAGDVSDDDLVDIVDMSIIGGKFAHIVDPLTERADVNADGQIDILDITLAGGNYMKVSPVPWP